MDYVYENAPLVEVIAEIHWHLTEIDQASNTKIDPYYYLFQQEFLSHAKEIGLQHVEELIPDFVPPQFTPNQPRLRLRATAENWPLAQLGPGIITVNIVPPYNGWKEFEIFLSLLVDELFVCYPETDSNLQIEKLHLRYIDGFGEHFGFDRYADFAKIMLGINEPLPEEFVNCFVKKDTEVTYLIESRFTNSNPDGSSSIVKLTPGKLKNKNALILEMQCESIVNGDSANNPGEIKHWFYEAHNCLHKQFNQLATTTLKSAMGKRREIEI